MPVAGLGVRGIAAALRRDEVGQGQAAVVGVGLVGASNPKALLPAAPGTPPIETSSYVEPPRLRAGLPPARIDHGG